MGKNVALSDDAIDILERLKRPGESYSDVVKRVAIEKPPRHDWRESIGAFKDEKNAGRIFDEIIRERHAVRKRKDLTW